MEHSAVNSTFRFVESNFWFDSGARLQFDQVKMTFAGSQSLSGTAYDSDLSTDSRLTGSSMELTRSSLQMVQNGWFELYEGSLLTSSASNISVDGTYSYFGITDSTWNCGDSATPCGSLTVLNGGYARIRGSSSSFQGLNATIRSTGELAFSASMVLFNGSVFIADENSYFTIQNGASVTIIQVRLINPLICHG
jgi:hypothetical protein